MNQVHRAREWILVILRWRGLMLLGLWSYSIYLWQQPFYLAKIDPALGAAFGRWSGNRVVLFAREPGAALAQPPLGGGRARSRYCGLTKHSPAAPIAVGHRAPILRRCGDVVVVSPNVVYELWFS